MNPLLYPTLLLTALSFYVGDRSGRRRLSALPLLLGLLLTLPAALFVIYYLHVLDRAAWFYQFRSLPFTELTAAGLGFLPGYRNARLRRCTALGYPFGRPSRFVMEERGIGGMGCCGLRALG